MKFSLVDFNTLGTPFFSHDISLRLKKTAEIINEENPDVVCLQEIVTYYHLALIKKYLKYPYFLYEKSLFGPKGGLLIATKLPIDSWKFKPFTTFGSFKNISFYSNLIKNGMLIYKVKNSPVIFINTHTVTDFEFEDSPTNKLYNSVKSQVKQIAAEVNKQSTKDKTVIVSGDFNLKKDSKLYNDFINETGAIDPFKKDSTYTYHKERLNYKFKGQVSARIDFIFVKNKVNKLKILSSENFLNKQYKLANNKLSYLSDHSGMRVNFDIN